MQVFIHRIRVEYQKRKQFSNVQLNSVSENCYVIALYTRNQASAEQPSKVKIGKRKSSSFEN